MYKIIPYVESNGARSISDNQLYYLYKIMTDNKLLEIVFYGKEVTTFESFLVFMKNKLNIINVVALDGNPLALTWINGININHCFAHFCSFPGAGGKHTVPIGKLMLDYWFNEFKKDDKPLIEVILGRTPKWNRAATIFLRRIGVTILGDIPNISWNEYTKKMSSLVISYIERSKING